MNPIHTLEKQTPSGPARFILDGAFRFLVEASHMDGKESRIVTAKELASMIGISMSKILTWYHEGVIPAEVAEGRVYRFDPEKVLLILKHRAAQRAEDETRPRRAKTYFPRVDMPPRKRPPHASKSAERGPIDPPSEPYAFMEMMRAREAREWREAKQSREEGAK